MIFFNINCFFYLFCYSIEHCFFIVQVSPGFGFDGGLLWGWVLDMLEELRDEYLLVLLDGLVLATLAAIDEFCL